MIRVGMIVGLLWASSALGETLFEVKAGGEMAGLRCESASASVENVGGAWSVHIPGSQDPYASSELVFSGSVPALPEGGVLEVSYMDKGASLMSAAVSTESGNALSKGRRSGYTRLNTDTIRSAWFELGAVPSPGTLTISLTGADHVVALRVLPPQDAAAWAAKAAAVPRKVTPMVVLKRPMDLVTSAGVDVRGGMETLDESIDALNDLAPLAKALGFTGIEAYVSWKRLEPLAEGQFDFSFYDAVVNKLKEYDLKLFPLLIVGSAYALPEWFIKSEDNVGMVCLEHGLTNPVQSICYEPHRRHVTRVLQAFGKHYEPMGVLQGVRLGPSGNYGESQYPAGGNWGVGGEDMHIHLGWWAGDKYAQADYRKFLAARYGEIAKLNSAWETAYASFDEISPRMPEQMLNPTERIDFTTWYTDTMTNWCEWWALETRKALPNTPIYQSAGGWGFRESGTDYSAQTKSMKLIDGGIRLTNETDSYEQNFYATRLAVSAAKHYGIPLGYEPASSHTGRGIAGRLYETLNTDGHHFFTYYGNVMGSDFGISQWLRYAPLLDERAMGRTSVAIYYPETVNQLEDSAFRFLYAWGFNPRAAAVRRVTEVDYLDDRLIGDGFLKDYRVLVFAWGTVLPDAVLKEIDAWVQAGGTVIYPSFPRGGLSGLSGDDSIFDAWSDGKTGKGSFSRFRGDMEPNELYGDFVRKVLSEKQVLPPVEQKLLAVKRPEHTFFSVLESGKIAALNYDAEPVTLELGSGKTVEVPGYGIEFFAMD